MPLKFYCPKCNKRFVDWGAEKLDFKCPDCKDETLYRVGTGPNGGDSAPALSKASAKRKAKAKVKDVPVPDLDDVSARALDDDDDIITDDGDDSELIDDSLVIDD